MGVSGAGRPGTAPQVPVLLTEHAQRVQPGVLARAVPGLAGVRPRVGSSEPLEEQGAAIRRHPVWEGQDVTCVTISNVPTRQRCSVLGCSPGINRDHARVSVPILDTRA